MDKPDDPFTEEELKKIYSTFEYDGEEWIVHKPIAAVIEEIDDERYNSAMIIIEEK